MEVDTEVSEHRLLHLDLKGAPPKVNYLEEIIPLLPRWGATGLLMEYEDMCPYSGNLSELACSNAYSSDDIGRLINLAKKHNLIVIPLIQTYGHFEFVLKHEKWLSLREVPISPLTLCPLNSGSLVLIKEMIDQILSLHSQSKWLHIGADEVYHIGICEKCSAFMKEHEMTQAEVFLFHIRRVLEYVCEKYPSVQCIMWDDMLRAVDVPYLKKANISKLVQPMVWLYGRNFDISLEVFDTVWVASAFKGATGPRMFATDIAFHADNQKMWLAIVAEYIKSKFKYFHGYAVTGWSRYDHYAVLCELLPVGLPSLVICLLTLKHGGFTEEVHQIASKDLNFSSLLPLVPFNSVHEAYSCDFPGCRVFLGIQHFIKLRLEYKLLMSNDRVKAWMTPYHVRHNYTNPVHLEFFLVPATEILNSLKSFRAEMLNVFAEIFYADAIEEWLAVNIDVKIERLSQLVKDAMEQVEIGGRTKGHITSA